MNRHPFAWCALVVVALVAVSAGCASRPPQEDPAQSKVALNDIDRAALQASESLARLSEIERSAIERKLPKTPAASSLPAALQRKVTMQWVGPADAAASRLASWSGYQFKVYGKAPAVPVIVNVDRANATIYDLLVDIGQQAGVRADVTLDTKNHLIGFYYAK